MAPSMIGIRFLPGSGWTSGEVLGQCGGGRRRFPPHRAGLARGRREVGVVMVRAVVDRSPIRAITNGTRVALVIQVEPTLMQAAVGAEQVAVVGGAHKHGVGWNHPP